MTFQLIILSIITIISVGASQVLLKYGALYKKDHSYLPDYLKPYLNRYAISGYCLLLVVTVISIYILKEMPLKLFFPVFISINLIVVVALSYLILHEPLTCRKLVAIGIIVCGVLIACIP